MMKPHVSGSYQHNMASVQFRVCFIGFFTTVVLPLSLSISWKHLPQQTASTDRQNEAHAPDVITFYREAAKRDAYPVSINNELSVLLAKLRNLESNKKGEFFQKILRGIGKREYTAVLDSYTKENTVNLGHLIPHGKTDISNWGY